MKTLIACLLGLLVHHDALPATPAESSIEAVLVLMNGTEVGSRSPQELTTELDGSVVQLGSASCTISNAGCVLNNVKEGTYAPSLTIKHTGKRVVYSVLGTSSGALVNLRRDQQKRLLVMPQKITKLIFMLERHYDDMTLTTMAAPLGARYDSAKVDSSLKLNVWINITDKNEGVSYRRRPHPGELAGIRLRLGTAFCEPEGEICRFKTVAAGTFKLDGEFPDAPNVRWSIDPDTRPLVIELDWWTKRPRVRGVEEELSVNLEKELLETR